MNEVVKKVRYGGKEVGTVTIPIYDNVEELAENETGEYILAQFNKGNTITLMANERNKHKPATAGKQKRTMIGLSLITTEEFQECAGDMEKIKALVESDAVQTRIDEYLDAQGETAD